VTRRGAAVAAAAIAAVAGLSGCAARAGASQSIEVSTAYVPAMRPNGVQMLITGAGPMRGGKDITLTLRFARAGQVSVVAQVTNPDSGGSSYFLS